MKVAEVTFWFGRSFNDGMATVVCFDTLEVAQAEFEKMKDLLDRRAARNNDLPKTIEVRGINSFSCPLDEVSGVGLMDLVKHNAEERGVKEAYPNLFQR